LPCAKQPDGGDQCWGFLPDGLIPSFVFNNLPMLFAIERPNG
jgi:hypothetical protein